jgi:hypothetical protein
MKRKSPRTESAASTDADNHVPVSFLRVVGKLVHPIDAYFVKKDEIKAR